MSDPPTPKFLNDVAPRLTTERTYRTALRRLQTFAVEKGYTEKDVPLPPHAIHATFLAEFYSWLKDQKKKVKGIRGRKKAGAKVPR